jgi:hypothetical protein
MQITNVNDLQEGDVMVLGGRNRGVLPWDDGKHLTLFVGHIERDWVATRADVQDLMDHGIPFERREK